jgi:hypothetical protein
LPVYFVIGAQDGNLPVNQLAHQKLGDAGNNNLEFVTFEGGHDYRTEDVEGMYLWMKEFTNNNITRVPLTTSQQKVLTLDLSPNPGRNIIQMDYTTPADGLVYIEIFNQMGQLEATIVHAWHPAESYSISWSSGDLPMGVYCCRLSAGAISISKKLAIRR